MKTAQELLTELNTLDGVSGLDSTGCEQLERAVRELVTPGEDSFLDRQLLPHRRHSAQFVRIHWTPVRFGVVDPGDTSKILPKSDRQDVT